MAPPKRPWFRFYVEALTDPKLRRLTPEQRWVWVAVLGAARQSPIPGRLLITTEIAMNFEDLSELSGVNLRRTRAAVDAMTALGLVTVDDGEIVVPSWSTRQFESDESTNRVAEHRRKAVDGTTIGRYIDVSVTPPETETETDISIDHPDDGFDAFWNQYPRKEGKKLAATRWKNLTKRDRDAALAALPAHIRLWRNEGRQHKYIKQPAVWLNGRHWEDEITGQRGTSAIGAGGVEIENAT